MQTKLSHDLMQYNVIAKLFDFQILNLIALSTYGHLLFGNVWRERSYHFRAISLIVIKTNTNSHTFYLTGSDGSSQKLRNT